jgi:hypothetical protein
MAKGIKTGGRQKGTPNKRPDASYAREVAARVAERGLDVVGLLLNAAQGDDSITPQQFRALLRVEQHLERARAADAEEALAPRASDPWNIEAPEPSKEHLEDPYQTALRNLEHAERELRRLALIGRAAYPSGQPLAGDDMTHWTRWGSAERFLQWMQASLLRYGSRGPAMQEAVEKRMEASHRFIEPYMRAELDPPKIPYIDPPLPNAAFDEWDRLAEEAQAQDEANEYGEEDEEDEEDALGEAFESFPIGNGNYGTRLKPGYEYYTKKNGHSALRRKPEGGADSE